MDIFIEVRIVSTYWELPEEATAMMKKNILKSSQEQHMIPIFPEQLYGMLGNRNMS